MMSKYRIVLALLVVIGGAALAAMVVRNNRVAQNALAAAEEKNYSLEKELLAVREQLARKAREATRTYKPVTNEGALLVDQQSVIEDLRNQLAARSAEVELLRNRGTNSVVPNVIQARQPDERINWLENLQTNDPVRYKEIMEQRENARQAAKYDIAKKAAHFLYRDDVEMTEDEAKQYQQMMTLLDESMKLTEKLNADLPQDERREISRSLRQNMRELSPLLESERDKELYRIGKDLGYTDEDAAGFALYIRDVIDVTSVNNIFRNTMRGMGGWGGGGGGDWGGSNSQNRPPPP